MHRRFIAGIVVAALAITAVGSAPARADDDALKVLAAIAGIAIVGKVLHDRNTRKADQQRASRQVKQTPVYRPTERVIQIEPRPLPDRANRKLLPGDCLRSVNSVEGRVRYFGRRCLERNYGAVARLPEHCAVRLTGQGLDRRGYEARCLNRAGYKLARR